MFPRTNALLLNLRGDIQSEDFKVSDPNGLIVGNLIQFLWDSDVLAAVTHQAYSHHQQEHLSSFLGFSNWLINDCKNKSIYVSLLLLLMWKHADSFGFMLWGIGISTPNNKSPGDSRKSSQHFWFHIIWVIWTLYLDRSDWINLLAPETVGWGPVDPLLLPLSVICIQIFLPGPHIHMKPEVYIHSRKRHLFILTVWH